MNPPAVNDGEPEGGRQVDEAPSAPPRSVDRWAHRRGEPRLFTLLWSIYLLVCALATIFSVKFLGMTQAGMFRSPAKSMLLLAAIGATVLWPMVRLSQARPRKPLKATALDLIAVNGPLQAVVWPTKLLTGWGWEVMAGLSLLLLSWTALLGALVAAGVSREAGPARSWWMLLCLMVVGGAPAAMLVGGLFGFVPAPDGWLASPLTALFAITEAPSGLSAGMTKREWVAVAAPGVVAGVCWGLLTAGGAFRERAGGAAGENGAQGLQ